MTFYICCTEVNNHQSDVIMNKLETFVTGLVNKTLEKHIFNIINIENGER